MTDSTSIPERSQVVSRQVVFTECPRTLGVHEGARPGPLFIAVGGIHGNEPCGIEALARVLGTLEACDLRIEGRFVALSGNRTALARGVRWVDVDLNRVWPDPGNAGAPHERPHDSVEAHEQRELLEVIGAHVDEGWSRVVVLDLHSTSAGGPPFCILADSLQNRAITRQLPLPMVLGLEESVNGTLLGHFSEQGHVAVSLESGKHDDATSVDHAESTVWLMLVAAGVIAADDVPDHAAHHRRLARVSQGAPRFAEVLYREPVSDGERFAMEPGFENFQRVARGRRLARVGDSLEHTVDSPRDGRLLMPLYQRQGDDGFFVVREVWPGWLGLSRILRTVGAQRLAHWLPGVRRHPERRNVLLVNPRVARFLSRELFHLLGFRRCRQAGAELVFRRRRDDHPATTA